MPAGYRVDVVNHLVPGIGAHRLEKLTPEHVEHLYAKLQRTGWLRAALPRPPDAAGRPERGCPAIPPGPQPGAAGQGAATGGKGVEPYGIEELQRLLDVAGRRRNSARWALALALGLRQGEALGHQPVKSRAGRRTIGLPPQLVELFRAHQADQDREWEQARQE